MVLGTKQTRWADVFDASDSEADVYGPDRHVESCYVYRDDQAANIDHSTEVVKRRLVGRAGSRVGPDKSAFILKASKPARMELKLPQEGPRTLSGRRDFAQLFGAAGLGNVVCSQKLGDKDKAVDQGDHAAATRLSSEEDQADVWRPNINAPEFIPTLTMTCPLVGVYSQPPRQDGASDSQPGLATLEDPSPAESLELQYRQKTLKKRLPAPASQVRSAGKGPSSGARRTCKQKLAIVPQTNLSHDKASEVVDVQARADRRQKFMEGVHRLPEYHRFLQARCAGHVEDSEALHMPDPCDTSISNRQWRWLLSRWILALKHRYGDGCESMMSADEWQSTRTNTSAGECSAVEEWQSGYTATSNQDASALEVEDLTPTQAATSSV